MRREKEVLRKIISLCEKVNKVGVEFGLLMDMELLDLMSLKLLST